MSWCMSLSPMLSLIRPFGSLPSVVSHCPWPSLSASALSPLPPGSPPVPPSLHPKVSSARCTEAPFSRTHVPSPAPGGPCPVTSRPCGLHGQKRGLLFQGWSAWPAAPALIRLITVHTAGGRLARPPLSHGLRRKPLSAAREQSGDSAARPLRPCGAAATPFCVAFCALGPLSLSACGSPGCLPIVSLSRILFLSSSVRASASLSSLCLSVAPSLPVHPEASCPVSPLLVITPMARVHLICSPWPPVCLRPSPFLPWGPQSLGSF